MHFLSSCIGLSRLLAMTRSRFVFLAVIVCLTRVFAFNLDVKDPFIYKGTSGEYFGYTVVLHRQRAVGNWVIVGAPFGNKTSGDTERTGYGSVYKCSSNSQSNPCQVITIDNSNPLITYWRDENGVTLTANLEEKNGQMLGATLDSIPTQDNGALLACAPKYTFRGEVARIPADARPEDRRKLLLGKCFLVRNDLSGRTSDGIRPCYRGDNGFSDQYNANKEGACEAGFSAALSQDGLTVLMGAPGRYLLNGSISVFYSDTQDSARTFSALYPDLSSGSALGYAVGIGNFKSQNKRREEFLASSTRANNLLGKVVAFDVNTDNFDTSVSFTLPLPTTAQLGSNFGQCLCVVDLNNDGFSDLLIGAPYYRHSEYGDEGRVYTYMNSGKTPGTLNHKESMTLDGRKTTRSLFGYAMAVAGDLNRDGFIDVAISAPYGGKDRGGVVFIYFGTKDGIESSFRQAIEASDISVGVKTFGFSLAGNVDVDNNGYPDLAVGAYSSDRAFLLRSRPIVEMEGELKLSVTQISLEDNKTVQLAADGLSRKSINVTVCLKYKNQMPSLGQPNVSFSVELDKDRFTDGFDLRRMFFFQEGKTTFSITRHVVLTKQNEWHCQLVDTAYLREKDQLQDVFDPLTFDLTYDLSQSPSCTLCPILNDHNDIAQRSFRATVGFVKQCGNDKICQPDLAIKGSLIYGDGKQNELLIGDVKTLTVRVEVENKAQDAAYPGKVMVTYPSLIDYAYSEDVSCSTKLLEDGNRQAECAIGNPFRGNTKKQFDVIFNAQRITGNITQFSIHLEATSGLSEDVDKSNNKESLQVPVKFEADLSIVGFSNPDQVVYKDKVSEVKNAFDIGPSVKQTITVRNNGPSPIEYAEVTIEVPFKYNKEEGPNYLLYLMGVDVLGNAGSCNVKSNPLNLQLNTNNSQREQESSSSKVRRRREVAQTNEELPCKSDNAMTCLRVPCVLGRMKKGDDVKIQIRSRLWQNTLIKTNAGSMNLTTTAQVTPPTGVKEPKTTDNIVTIRLTANPKTTPKSGGGKVAAWIIIVSILGGLLLFCLVGFALYKFGFFKRKRFNKDEVAEEELTPMRTLEPSSSV